MRCDGVREFVAGIRPLNGVQICIERLLDIYGPSVDPKYGLDAIVASEETVRGAQRVNARRAEKGLPELRLLTVDYVTSHGERLSSTMLRRELRAKQPPT